MNITADKILCVCIVYISVLKSSHNCRNELTYRYSYISIATDALQKMAGKIIYPVRRFAVFVLSGDTNPDDLSISAVAAAAPPGG
jgi:hypothetical protein